MHLTFCLGQLAPPRRQRTCNSLRPDGVETELTTVKRTRNTTTTVQRQSRARAAAAAEALHPDSLPVSVCRCVLLQPQSQSLPRCPLSLSGYLSLFPSLIRSFAFSLRLRLCLRPQSQKARKLVACRTGNSDDDDEAAVAVVFCRSLNVPVVFSLFLCVLVLV